MTQGVSPENADCSDGGVPSNSRQRAVRVPGNVPTIIGTITSQVVFVTALLYYFGYVYARWFFDYFGVDPSLVGYTTADYVLRSINVTLDPLTYLVFAAFALFNIHRFVVVPALMRATGDLYPMSNSVNSGVSGRSSQSANHPPQISQTVAPVVGWARVLGRWRLRLSEVRRIIGALQAVAIIFAVAVLAVIVLSGPAGAPLGYFLPLLLMLTVGLLGYIQHLHLRHVESCAAMTTPSPPTSSLTYTVALVAVGMVAGLWTVYGYAEHVGHRRATEFAADLPAKPGIVIYSAQRISLIGPGVTFEELQDPDSKYHYRYIGFRLLVRSADKFLLLPAQWQHGRDHVIFLQDGNDVRIDVTAW